MTRQNQKKERGAEARIKLRSFHSSEALKSKIRKTTEDYRKKGMSLMNIESCGEFIYLRFGLLRCNE